MLNVIHLTHHHLQVGILHHHLAMVLLPTHRDRGALLCEKAFKEWEASAEGRSEKEAPVRGLHPQIAIAAYPVSTHRSAA